MSQTDDEADDLQYIATRDLIAELLKRFDRAMFVGMVGHDTERFKIVHRCKGDPFALAGLAQVASNSAIMEAFEVVKRQRRKERNDAERGDDDE